MNSSAATLAPAPPLRAPFRLAIAVLVAMTLTILQGAMTTSTDSGLAYADWPFSEGQLMPESSYTRLPQFFEHFHRLFAVATGLLALALWLLLKFSRRADASVRWHAFFGGLLILLQGVVGGVGVWWKLPVVTSATHGTLAQLTLATFAWLAYRLSGRPARTLPVTSVPPYAGRKLVLAALVVLVLQTVLGAIARHANSSHALWTHVGHSFVVFLVGTIATAFAVGKLREAPGIRGIARTIVTLLIVQMVLGFVALAIRNSAGKAPENIDRLGAALTISVHVLVGALLTALTGALAAHVFRATRPVGAP